MYFTDRPTHTLAHIHITHTYIQHTHTNNCQVIQHTLITKNPAQFLFSFLATCILSNMLQTLLKIDTNLLVLWHFLFNIEIFQIFLLCLLTNIALQHFFFYFMLIKKDYVVCTLHQLQWFESWRYLRRKITRWCKMYQCWYVRVFMVRQITVIMITVSWNICEDMGPNSQRWLILNSWSIFSPWPKIAQNKHDPTHTITEASGVMSQNIWGGTIFARERSDRAGGGCGRGVSPLPR